MVNNVGNNRLNYLKFVYDVVGPTTGYFKY
jgi:hypothetical protein